MNSIQHNNLQVSNQSQARAQSEANQVNVYRQYDRIRLLGKGSFGTATVYRRRTDKSLVVLKEIDLHKLSSEGKRQFFIQEAKIMSELNHINIIKYYNAYTSDDKLIIEMEYASVGSLRCYLSLQEQHLEEREILIIFRQILSGLEYLHSKNIVHLDLKMANLFVTLEGVIKIGDFGIARHIQPDASDKSRTLNQTNDSLSQLGTLAYSSPERCRGLRTTSKSDIWSLGCILYELITRQQLFTANSLAELVTNIKTIKYEPIKRKSSTFIKEVFERMIVADPNQRPDASELLELTLRPMINPNMRRHKVNNRTQKHGFHDIATDMITQHRHQQDCLDHLNLPHSLVYQVRLDTLHLRVEQVNLPQTKRIKEICKGKSHYLVLTYDNIVYGWGSKTHGQLGSCGLTSSSSSALGRGFKTNANLHASSSGILSSGTSSLASSTQTIISQHHQNQSNQPYNDKTRSSRQVIMDMLANSAPASRPFVINELNHRRIIQVSAGNNFSVFLSKTGIVMACGDGSTGCLGRGDMKSCFTPVMVECLLNNDVISVACGRKHVVAVCGNGRAFAWGNSADGRLGIGPSRDNLNQKDIIYLSSMHRPQSKPFRGRSTKSYLVLTPQPVIFPPNVQIKSVFSGDRCSVFIDSEHRVWACGQNRFNKLGLDVKRCFRRTTYVDCCWTPTEVTELSKYKIVTCSIGKNHSTFLTSEGKLIVLGQDIDHTHKLEQNIMDRRDSRRRISRELNARRSVSQGQNWKDSKWSIYGNKMALGCGSRQRIDFLGASSSSKINRESNAKRKRNLRLHLDKTRAKRKMPFEGVISISCSQKFSLALTNDNRVYFWGTRSHETDGGSTKAILRTGRNRTVEPQLIANCSDESFIRMGAINTTLMENIQTLGSDQPIIQPQDPRLVAKSVADLWILDYKPSLIYSSTTSSSSSSSSPELGMDSKSSERNSCCSSCGDLETLDNCLCSISLDDDDDDYMKHDAILEPQPIVCLYVPAMFNLHGNSLHFVDLFCFDDDRFYIILDTTLRIPQVRSGIHSSRHNNRYSLNYEKTSHRGSQPGIARKSPSAKLYQSHDMILKLVDQPVAHSPRNDDRKSNPICCRVPMGGAIEESLQQLKNHQYQELRDDVINANCEVELEGSICSVVDRSSQTDCVLMSPLGGSLEEPRSLSTFAAASLGNHVVMSPSMRQPAHDRGLKPILFDANSPQDDSSPCIDGGLRKIKHPTRSSRTTTKSDNSTQTNGNDITETSSMPSWVRHEFNQQQQFQHAQSCHLMSCENDHMFALDSSDTELTCMSRLTISSKNAHLEIDETSTIHAMMIEGEDDRISCSFEGHSTLYKEHEAHDGSVLKIDVTRRHGFPMADMPEIRHSTIPGLYNRRCSSLTNIECGTVVHNLTRSEPNLAKKNEISRNCGFEKLDSIMGGVINEHLVNLLDCNIYKNFRSDASSRSVSQIRIDVHDELCYGIEPESPELPRSLPGAMTDFGLQRR